MVEPIVEPTDKLSSDEIRAIPQNERGKFIELSVLALIEANSKRGLTISEIERVTQYPKNTLYKHVDLAYAKRKINKKVVGNSAIYYTNGQIFQELIPKDIIYGSDKRYGVRLLETVTGSYIYIQEKELNEKGFFDDIGGVLIPIAKIPELINMFNYVLETKLK